MIETSGYSYNDWYTSGVDTAMHEQCAIQFYDIQFVAENARFEK